MTDPATDKLVERLTDLATHVPLGDPTWLGGNAEHIVRLVKAAVEAAAAIQRLTQERDELQRTFDLRWNADMRAIKRWQEAHPGNDNIWPDHADLVIWLLKRAASAEAERDRLRAALSPWLEWAEDNLSEFDVAGDECDPNGSLCPRCQSNGCLQLKIREARAALTGEVK